MNRTAPSVSQEPARVDPIESVPMASTRVQGVG